MLGISLLAEKEHRMQLRLRSLHIWQIVDFESGDARVTDVLTSSSSMVHSFYLSTERDREMYSAEYCRNAFGYTLHSFDDISFIHYTYLKDLWRCTCFTMYLLLLFLLAQRFRKVFWWV